MVKISSPSRKRRSFPGFHRLLEQLKKPFVPHRFKEMPAQQTILMHPKDQSRFRIDIIDYQLVIHHHNAVIDVLNNGFAFQFFGDDLADVHFMEFS